MPSPTASSEEDIEFYSAMLPTSYPHRHW